MADYQERYCGYVDILGFRGIVKELGSGSIDVRTMLEIFHRMHGRPFLRATEDETAELKVQTISDAICASAAVNSTGLQYLLFSLTSLARGLLELGYFVRGGVVKGRLYHDDHTVFGEALVDAFEIESATARYPRIMLRKEVVEDLKRYQEQEIAYGDYFRQAEDGPFFLHILTDMEYLMRMRTEETDAEIQAAHFNIMAEKLQRRFDDAVDNPRHFEKVRWFAHYWNETRAPFKKHIIGLAGPGMNVIKWTTDSP